jgi:hypothetical protein
MSNNQQITRGGIPQQSGLETFSSIINYTGEYVNFGNAIDYGTALKDDAEYITETATPHIGALVGSPPSIMNQWYKYRSAGVLYTSPSPAISNGSQFVLYGIETGGLPSYCGMYQKLLLTTGKEYKVRLRMCFSSSIGSLTINTYTLSGTESSPIYTLTSTATKEIPNSSGDLGLLESDFIATSSNDIVLVYFTTTETSMQSSLISSISIQEKQDYLVPVYVQDIYGNAHKVLRLNAGNTISDD